MGVKKCCIFTGSISCKLCVLEQNMNYLKNDIGNSVGETVLESKTYI